MRKIGWRRASRCNAEVIGHDELLTLLAPTVAAEAVASRSSSASDRGAVGKRRSTRMDCFAGLDVSIDETAICVVDAAGKVDDDGVGGDRSRGNRRRSRAVY